MASIKHVHFFILAVVFVVIHLVLFYSYGVRSLFDSKLYINSADFLVANGAFDQAYRVLYAVPIGILAFCRLVFPEQVIPFLVVQILLSAVACLSLYRAAERLFNSHWAGFYSVSVFLFWWDNIHWNTTVMTESIFYTLVCLLIYKQVTFSGKRSDWIWIVFLLIALFLTRPTGIVVAIAILLFLIRYYWNSIFANQLFRVLLIIGLTVVAISGAYIMFSIWDFTEQLEKGNIITYADVAEASPLFDESLQLTTDGLRFPDEKNHPLIKLLNFIAYNPVHFVKAAALKIFYLITAIRPYYSWQHNMFTVFWLTVLYGTSFFGYRKCLNVPVRNSLLIIIMINCLLVGISTVDWDNRFYIPMAPGIVLLAGGGAAYLIKKFLKREG